ncbi:MAG: 4Fe-4S binding protein [Clostridiales bacterium]|nr:4Fe-4S binding protein [Clostridiales bacterium]
MIDASMCFGCGECMYHCPA